MFLDFTNFYKSFIRIFCRIAVLLTLMLRITSNNNVSISTSKNKTNQNIPSSASNDTGDGGIGRGIENLSTVANLTKGKNPNLTYSKPKNWILQ